MALFFLQVLIWWPILILVLLGLAAARARRGVWIVSLGALWIVLASTSSVDPVIKRTLLALYILGVLATSLPFLRRAFISRPLLRFYRAAMPELSTTEREALEAGGVWWDADLFSGTPDWQQLLDFPAARISAEEQAYLDGPVERLCAMLDDHRICNVDKDLTPETWSFIKERGFFGMTIPKEYGGLAFSATGHASVVMKIAS